MKNKLIFPAFILLILIVVITACDNVQDKNKKAFEMQKKSDENVLSLLQANCFTCHNPESGIPKRLAPPMYMVRNHYFDTNITKDVFVSYIVNWVNNPTEENSIMPGAVRNFGVMPKQIFNQEDLKLIAAYIYDNDLESDAWYEKWEAFKKTAKPQPQNLSYEDQGLNYANGTKSQLGMNLLAAIKELGTAGAVTFCNTKAIVLTDSMAGVYQTSIKRVSDKPRNPGNQANERELSFIEELKSKLAKGEKSTSKVFEHNGKMVGYYSIETNAMCLQCHGNKGKEIKQETAAVLKKLYPKDMATGYAENQVRGIWVVEMNKR